MQFKSVALLAMMCCIATVARSDESETTSPATTNTDFWLWFAEYTDESGEVFDPLDLETAAKLAAELQSDPTAGKFQSVAETEQESNETQETAQ